MYCEGAVVMAKEIEVRFKLPADFAEKILNRGRVDEWKKFGDIHGLCRHLAMSYFDDARRRAMPVRRMSLGFRLDFFEALVKKVGSGGIAKYLRDSLWDELKRQGLTKNLSEPPDWRDQRAVNAGKKRQSKAKGDQYYTTEDRPDTHIHAILLPQDWFDAVENLYPQKASSFVKACAQERLQKETGKLYTCQRTMEEFLSDWKE